MGILFPAQARADLDAIKRGGAIYQGVALENRHLAFSLEEISPVSPRVAACMGCHRPSGLGSFEGGIAVPPITGEYLFTSFEPLTVNRFPWPTKLRKRPAYSSTELRKTLLTGITIDGLEISGLMPRYAFSQTEIDDLSLYLRSLSENQSPGISDEKIRFATITTPDADENEKNAVLLTLSAFFNDKNAQTRLEVKRKKASQANKEEMYARYKNWELDHWSLIGAPETWAGQLEVYYQKAPVFAILSGIGNSDWSMVDDFCSRHKIPCVFPQISITPSEHSFYSIFFDEGLGAQVRWMRDDLSTGLDVKKMTYAVLTEFNQSSFDKVGLIKAKLSDFPAAFTEVALVNAEILISILSVEDTINTLEKNRLKPTSVYVLQTNQKLPKPDQWMILLNQINQASTWNIVDRFQIKKDSNKILKRASSWLNGKKLKSIDEVIAANALFAATVTADALTHADANFSREYFVEKLEHAIENTIPLTPYLRLGLSSSRHIASKGFNIYKFKTGQTEFEFIPITTQ